MARVEFLVLGPLGVVDDGRPVPLGRRKQRALLALLLLHANEPLAPDRLIEELWTGRPPAQARLNLQAYVSNLRRVLDPSRSARGSAGALALTPGGYVLTVEPERLDAHRFERLVEQARAAAAAARFEAADEHYREALALWRGDVLADVADDLPPQPAIARLNELRLTAIEGHMAAGLDAGRHAELVSELEALVMEQPLRERLREQLAVALYRSGRQADALEQLRKGRALLVGELGIEPGPALQRLERLILRQSDELEWRAPEAVAPQATATGATPGGRPPERQRLVGRAAEFDALKRAWSEAAAGRGRVVLMSGEPGIGKTRMAEELAAHVADHGGAVYWGRSFEAGGAPTFWPWVQALSEVVEGMRADDLRRLLGPRAGTLAQLVPEIGERLDEAAVVQGVDAAEARFRLYDGVVRFVLRLAENRPVAVVLDDLHWADPPSLELLGLLAARLREARILLVATYRDTELDRSEALAAALAGLAREAPLERLTLRGLAVSGVSDFLDDRLGRGGNERLAVRVHERTDGNPFYVSELVQLLVREQGPDSEVGSEAAWDQIPIGVREVIERRVSHLPSESAEVLEAAAVVGRDFSIPTLAAALGTAPLTVLQALEPAIAGGLVEELGDQGTHFRFAHALVRETVYEGLAAGRRASLHGAVAAALQGAGDPMRLSEVAHHYEKAVAIGFADRAVDASLAAADHAHGLVAFEQAEAHLRRALEIVDRHPDPRRELVALSNLAALLVMTQGYTAPELPRIGRRFGQIAADVGDAPEVADLMWVLWTYTCVRAEFGPALSIAEELTEQGRRTGDRAALAAGLQARGTSLWHVGRIAEAVDSLQAAIAAAGELDDAEFRTRSLQHPALIARTHASHAFWLLGDASQAAQVIAEARRLAEEVGTPYERAFSLYLSGWHGVVVRDFADGERWCRQALALCREHGFRQLSAFTEIMLGAAEAHTGRAAAGVDRLREGIDAFLATGSRMLGHFHQALLADALLAARRPAEARTAIEQALAESRLTGESFYLSEVLRLKGEAILAAEGDPEEARECVREAIEVAERQGARAIAERAEATLARIAAPAGRS